MISFQVVFPISFSNDQRHRIENIARQAIQLLYLQGYLIQEQEGHSSRLQATQWEVPHDRMEEQTVVRGCKPGSRVHR